MPKKSTETAKSAAKKKTSSKKSSSAQKKTSASKKAAPKKNLPPKQTAPEQKSLFAKKTIAQRTVDWKTGIYFNTLRWVCIIPLLLLMVFFQFFMVGYSFTVLVLGCIMGIILIYNCLHLLQKKYPKDARTLRRMFTAILCIGLLVCGVTEAMIIHASFGEPKQSCEYVVVLGAKVRPEGPSVSLMDRIRAAEAYMTEHPDVIAVVSGGQGPDEPMSEAQCMYEQLIKLGVDPQRIWMEDKATSTWENLNFSLNLIEEKTGTRPQKIGLLSSEYHLYRAGLFADACGVDSVGIPARTSRISQRINHFMREVAGVWHYILMGGQYDA